MYRTANESFNFRRRRTFHVNILKPILVKSHNANLKIYFELPK